jgi:hypothetical protein
MDYDYVKTLHIIAAMVVFASVFCQYIGAFASLKFGLAQRRLHQGVVLGITVQILTGLRLVHIAQFPYSELWIASSLGLLGLFVIGYYWGAQRLPRSSRYYILLLLLYLAAVSLMVLRPEWP